MVKYQNAGNNLEISALRNFHKRLTEVNRQCIVASRVHPSHKYFWGGMKEEAVKAGLLSYDDLIQQLKDHNKREEEQQFISDVIKDQEAKSSKD